MYKSNILSEAPITRPCYHGGESHHKDTQGYYRRDVVWCGVELIYEKREANNYAPLCIYDTEAILANLAYKIKQKTYLYLYYLINPGNNLSPSSLYLNRLTILSQHI